jgi:hypothetical protein
MCGHNDFPVGRWWFRRNTMTNIFTIAGVAFQAIGSSPILSNQRERASEKISYFIGGIGFEAIDVSPKEPYLLSGIAFESASWKIGAIYLTSVLLLLGFLSILLSPHQPDLEKRTLKEPISRTNSRNSLYQSPSPSPSKPNRCSTTFHVVPREDPFLIIGSPR